HAGQDLYTKYHPQEDSDPNASLYDIKEFFSGRNAKGKLKPASKAKDAHYKMLYAQLKEVLEALAQALQPKVYAYGFLR
ncbi:nucleoside 5-triphosphatase RdgB (dHAPTP, dITP,XTP-specific), partial [Helicobacter heilmannii]|uniref:nucleoside 5-triphosphatase RdgB (dHAPTP, dITP,XTP-specific) n=1 Tax=Helicobacter heilmannii TaxID=35817 RepID=UPI0009EA8AB6